MQIDHEPYNVTNFFPPHSATTEVLVNEPLQSVEQSHKKFLFAVAGINIVGDGGVASTLT
ncbi:hypothetical protein L484_005517 [Morus notabilis]|uniref:Uncharacterized protein n=1 Tax=Morus notabilis TaxID=981085 RepID=W9RVM1_9ROSA|nr:hypothetical protein L484_005517 [Morus notabilis]